MAYPSDLNDQQWEIIKDHFNMGNYGKGRKHSQRLLVDAVFYVIKTGCQWRFCLKNTLLLGKLFIVFINELKTRDFGKKL